MKFKIIEGFREEFENQFNEMVKEGWLIEPETYRHMELACKLYYSIMFSKEEEK